jgi:hypothetical protein
MWFVKDWGNASYKHRLMIATEMLCIVVVEVELLDVILKLKKWDPKF